MFKRDDSQYQYFSIDEISTPKDGDVVCLNSYWLLTEDNKVAIYKGITPQCNSDIKIAELRCKQLGYKTIVQIQVAYVPGSCYY